MLLTKDEIIEYVRLRLDEIQEHDSDLDELTDETDLNKLIVGLALEAMRFVNSNASVSLLEPDRILSVNGNNSIAVDGNELPEDAEVVSSRIQNRPPSGVNIPEAYQNLAFEISSSVVSSRKVGVFSGIPSNFLRLRRVTCESWRTPVVSAVPDDSAEWAILMNPYLTGSTENPMVGLSTESDGQKNIYLFCLKDDEAGVPKMTVEYMEDPVWTSDEKLAVSRFLTEPFYYYLASLVLSTMGDNRSQLAQSRAFPLMGIEAVQQAQ